MVESEIPFELRSLTGAHRYQSWIYSAVAPFLGKRILELGAGIGNMSRHLPVRELLVLSESDEKLLEILRRETSSWAREGVFVKKLDLSGDWVEDFKAFDLDTIVSFNVMEHVENDLKSFSDQLALLRQSRASGPKRLVAFVPSHQWAYGTLDREFLHYRRYEKKEILNALSDLHADVKCWGFHFNIVGLLGWWFKGKIQKTSRISASTVKNFERLIPFIRSMDDFLHRALRFPFGQSLIIVCELQNSSV